MIDYINSAVLQKYYKEIGFSFTDRQKATLIWAARQYKWRDILDSLRELAGKTTDIDLKKQIEERLDYEELKLARMRKNQENRFVYVVFDENYYARGFFRRFDAAYEYATQRRGIHDIEKQQIVEYYAPVFTTSLEHARAKRYDPAKLEEVYQADCDYFGGPVARCRVDEEGELWFPASVEVDGPQWLVEDEGRFENEYVEIPYPEGNEEAFQAKEAMSRYMHEGDEHMDVLTALYDAQFDNFSLPVRVQYENQCITGIVTVVDARKGIFDIEMPGEFVYEDLDIWKVKKVEKIHREIKAIKEGLGVKIWLDDLRPAPEGYELVRSVSEAQALIKQIEEEGGTIEVIDLDHDLGDYARFGGDGIKLLDYLLERDTLYPVKFHTANPVGRANMERMVQRYWP